ncbi:MAG: nitronate monooxygenase [candidate division KSB1 bacterium]|jgi:enoyl-[acyl-carrier protein] reductase II|nr:nitronate monooxygenase [candidate division KSB1 bacterium]
MNRLEQLWLKGKDFLGVEYPIMAGAMTWISDHKLVSAVSNAGGFGCLAAGNLPPQILIEEIDKTRRLTDKPFATNLITIAPNYRQHLEIAVEKKVPFIIFAGSFPRGSEIKIAKQNGARVMAFASNESIARRMINSGVDGLMLEGSEAGGHIGHVSLTILLQQVLFNIEDIPVFVAGGIASGRLMAHLLLMGAAGIQMGTRFVATKECDVHQKFKEAFIRARARDAIATPGVGSELNVVAVRAIRNKGMDDFADLQMDLIQKNRRGEISKKDAQYEIEHFWVGALRKAVQDGDIERGSLMAGQSVGLVNEEMTIPQVLEEMINDADAELERIKNRLAC